jgi:hypothetical protein
MLSYKPNLAQFISVQVAPVLENVSRFVSEGAGNASNIGAPLVATDPNSGDILTYSITAGNSSGIFAITNAGQLTVANNSGLDFETTALYTLTVQVTDGTDTDTAQVTVYVQDVYEALPPTLSGGTFSVIESEANAVLVGSPLNVSDGNANDTFAFSITAGNADGIFGINSSGQVFVLDNTNMDFETTTQYTLTVLVNDGTLTDTASVTINIQDVNEPVAPILNDLSVSVPENAADGTLIGAIITATDPNPMDTLTYSITAGNGDGIFDLNVVGNTFQLRVSDNTNLDYEATQQYSLTVQVGDGTFTDTAVYTVNVTNIAPQVSNATMSISEAASNSTVVGTVSASDPNGGTIVYSINSGDVDNIFGINTATGAISVTDNANLDFETTQQYILTVRAFDGTAFGEGTITVDVTNAAPSIGNSVYAISEDTSDGTFLGNLGGTDPNGGALTYSILSGNADGIFTLNNSGNLTMADNSNLDYETDNQYVLVVQVSDGNLTDTASITVNITNVAPTIDDYSTTIPESIANATIVRTFPISESGVVFSILSGNTNNAFTINSSGELSVLDNSNIDFETLSSYTLVVQVTDGVQSDTATVTLTVGNVAPIISDTSRSVAENATNGTTIGSPVTAVDPNGGTVVYSITGGNSSGIFGINSSTGQISVIDAGSLDFEDTSVYSLTVRASDGNLFDSATVTINVTNVAPVLGNVTTSLTEGAAVSTIATTMVATEAGSNALVYSILSGNTNNAFAINSSTGAIYVNVAAEIDYESISQFVLVVQASDGVLTDTATVTININNVAPTMSDETFSVLEDAANSTVIGTMNASDPNGTSLVYSILSGNTDNIFDINSSGQVFVTSNTNLNYEDDNQYVLVIRASDGFLNKDSTATVNITNVAPTISTATFNVVEGVVNTTFVGTVSASDPKGGGITYAILSGNTDSIFGINSSTGTITVVDNTDLDFADVQQYNLTVRASDGNLTDTATITINVTNVAPTLSNSTRSIPETVSNGTQIGADLLGNDNGGSTLSYTITAGNSSGVFGIVNANQLQVVNSTSVNFETTAQYSLTLQVSDGNASSTATFTINITNIAPSVSNSTLSVSEDATDSTVVGTVSASDPKGGGLTYSILSGNTLSAFSINSGTGQITVNDTTKINYETSSSFSLTVQVSDGALTDTASITINVNNVAPTFTGATFGINEGSANSTVVGQLSSTDPSGGTVTYTLLSGNSAGIFALSSSGELTVVNNSSLHRGYANSHTLSVQAGDGNLVDVANVTVNVNNVAPTASNATFSVNEASSVGFVVGPVSASDPSGSGVLTYAITGGNTGNVFTVNTSTGQITVNSTSINYETTTSYSLAVNVSDGSLSDNATITINVNNVAPSLSNTTMAVSESASDSAAVGTIVGTDPNGATLTYSILSGNTGTAFAINNSGQISVATSSTINYEVQSQYTLTVQVSDGNLTDTALVTINVSNVAPVFSNVSFNINEGSSNSTVVGQLSSTDPSGGTVTYSIVSGNASGIFALSTGGQLTIVNNTNLTISYATSHALTVRASDGSLTDDATVTVNVDNVAPIMNNFIRTVDEDATNGTNVGTTVSAADVNGATLTYSITAGNTGNAFAINNSGQITVNDTDSINYEESTSFSLTVQAYDGQASDTGIITVNIGDAVEPDFTDTSVAWIKGGTANRGYINVTGVNADFTRVGLAYDPNYGVSFDDRAGFHALNTAIMEWDTTNTIKYSVRYDQGILDFDAATFVGSTTYDSYTEYQSSARNDDIELYTVDAAGVSSYHSVMPPVDTQAYPSTYAYTRVGVDSLFMNKDSEHGAFIVGVNGTYNTKGITNSTIIRMHHYNSGTDTFDFVQDIEPVTSPSTWKVEGAGQAYETRRGPALRILTISDDGTLMIVAEDQYQASTSGTPHRFHIYSWNGIVWSLLTTKVLDTSYFSTSATISSDQTGTRYIGVGFRRTGTSKLETYTLTGSALSSAVSVIQGSNNSYMSINATPNWSSVIIGDPLAAYLGYSAQGEANLYTASAAALTHTKLFDKGWMLDKGLVTTASYLTNDGSFGTVVALSDDGNYIMISEPLWDADPSGSWVNPGLIIFIKNDNA